MLIILKYDFFISSIIPCAEHFSNSVTRLHFVLYFDPLELSEKTTEIKINKLVMDGIN